MKEKVTMFLTMSAIFSLFLYYKINPQDSVKISQVKVENKIEHVDSHPVFQVVTENESKVDEGDFCLMDQSETDELDFPVAFKYYRVCLDVEKTFIWNGQEYTTLLAEEIKVQNTDLVKSEEDTNHFSVDKTHMQLQNEMFGNSSNE
tara:strand:+ start:1426 stop:1866 length:441 start_codon:yes stop_codon:yes gene_type:complete